jgi:hypothetical protein
MLLKVGLGGFFYRRNSARSLRLYFMFRYIYNFIVIYTLIILFKFYSATYIINFFVAGGVLLILEIVITSIYCRYLCIKEPLENIEDVPGYKLVNTKPQSLVYHLQTKEASDYIINSLGKKSSAKIVEK